MKSPTRAIRMHQFTQQTLLCGKRSQGSTILSSSNRCRVIRSLNQGRVRKRNSLSVILKWEKNSSKHKTTCLSTLFSQVSSFRLWMLQLQRSATRSQKSKKSHCKFQRANSSMIINWKKRKMKYLLKLSRMNLSASRRDNRSMMS